MRDNDGWQGWVDFKNLRDLSLIEDETEMIILFSNNEVVLAKAKEIKIFLSLKIWGVTVIESHFDSPENQIKAGFPI